MRVRSFWSLLWLCGVACVADTEPLNLIPPRTPSLNVSTNELQFGEVLLGDSRQQTVILTNVGSATLDISRIIIGGDNRFVFSVQTTQAQLDPGESITVVVEYRPQISQVNQGELTIISNDPSKPETFVALLGEAIGPQECRFALSTERLDFGGVDSSQIVNQTVVATIDGTGPCTFRGFRIESNNTNAFSVIAPNVPIIDRPVGAQLEFIIAYRPQSDFDTANFVFETNSPRTPQVVIPLSGQIEFNVPIECGEDQVTAAGAPVDLLATSPLPIATWRWDIVEAPPGGIGTPGQWTPNEPNQASVQFLGFILGDYRIRVTGTDDRGNRGQCITNVQVRGNGLQITLTWDGPGDVDLHVHNDEPTPWFSSQDDCYYANRQPVWDPLSEPAEGSNPDLDFDNTQQDGPENTRIQLVQTGRPYFIGVHNFARAQRRIATVEIFCGQDVTPDLVISSRAFSGNQTGDCSGNEFWKVASITFTSQSTCNIEVLDNYVTAAEACRQR